MNIDFTKSGIYSICSNSDCKEEKCETHIQKCEDINCNDEDCYFIYLKYNPKIKRQKFPKYQRYGLKVIYT